MYENEKSEIQRLKQYLLNSLPPNLNLPPDSVAIRAAIAGLDKEVTRLDREEKLMQRFKAASDSGKTTNEDVDVEYVKMTKDDASPSFKEDEWMETATPDNSCTASKWASAAISRISSNNIKVGTALGALGVVLHSALMELPKRLRCTGVPSEDLLTELFGGKVAKEDGFAPPVRELPNGQLVPSNWEKMCNSSSPRVAFRYNCGRGEYNTESNDLTTLYLVVEPKDNQVCVYFGPMTNKPQQIIFPLDSYVNLDGIRAALEKKSPASPVLFYKSLKELLLLFGMQFGLERDVHSCFGSVSNAENFANVENADVGVSVERNQTLRPDVPTGPAAKPTIDPLRVDPAHTGRRNRGDFEGDLLPGGPMPGPDFSSGPVRGGSQVGPNHPLFDRTFGDNDTNHYGDDLGFDQGGPRFEVPGTGGMVMRPRFDPFGPPGGPTEPGRGGRTGRGGRGRGGRIPPGGLGFPNPDHLRPPGGDYFS